LLPTIAVGVYVNIERVTAFADTAVRPPLAEGRQCKRNGPPESIGGPFCRLDRDAVDADQTLGSPCALTTIVAPGGVVIWTRCS
jgi:hypothetical protein